MAREQQKTLILIRHAHRDTTNRALDNGLSEKGVRQVAAMEKALLRHFGMRPLMGALFFSSPKRRCVETLFPLSTLSKMGLKIDGCLDEQGEAESNREFSERVQVAAEFLTQLDGVVVVCSHGDWIPAMILHLTKEAVVLKKSAAAVLVSSEKGWGVSDTILTKS